MWEGYNIVFTFLSGQYNSFYCTKPHLHQSKEPNFYNISSPSPPMSAFLPASICSLSVTQSPPSPLAWSLADNAISHSVQLTNMEQEDWCNPIDDHTLSLPCLSPRKFWQARNTWGSSLITSVSHHTLCLWPWSSLQPEEGSSSGIEPSPTTMPVKLVIYWGSNRAFINYYQ